MFERLFKTSTSLKGYSWPRSSLLQAVQGSNYSCLRYQSFKRTKYNNDHVFVLFIIIGDLSILVSVTKVLFQISTITLTILREVKWWEIANSHASISLGLFGSLCKSTYSLLITHHVVSCDKNWVIYCSPNICYNWWSSKMKPDVFLIA